jgi:cyclopropane-fatty-acyl-phospholipid synthase
MATLKDIGYTYNDLDELWPLVLDDPYADITCAYYSGDYSKSLAEAQLNKHTWIIEGLNFMPGQRLIDIGCGWGPMLNAVREKGGQGMGLTLSSEQANTCNRLGLEVHLLDWKEMDPAKFDKFDAVVSLGAVEHFCSFEEYLAGQQEAIYSDFLKLCSDLLSDGGRLYLQTMTWGPSIPWDDTTLTVENIARYASLDAPKYSDERMLGYISALFPGSWLPDGKEQIVRLAEPYFDLIKASDGRLDYIQTLTEWIKTWHAPKPGKTRAKIKLLPNFILHGRNYWAKMKAIEENAVREVFIRNIFGHQRMFFRKKG